MRFSTKGHYGLRAMVVLAQAYGRGPVALADIARTEGMSLGYLEQLMAVLKRTGLVGSTRGSHGGYQLASDPASVTVGEVLRALQGPIAPAECASEAGSGTPCRRQTTCLSRPLWERVRHTLAEVLDSTTLADLCREGRSTDN